MSRQHTAKQFKLAIAEAQTIQLESPFAACSVILVELVMTGFTGTVDFKGSAGPDVTKANVRYHPVPSATVTPTVAQISETTTTGIQRYLITEPWPNIDVVVTRSAGSFDMHVFGYAAGVPVQKEA